MTSNQFGICLLAVVPLRAKPLHASEMISQLIFGDTFEILERHDSWINIKTDYDDYEAWVDEKQIVYIDHLIAEKLRLETQYLTKNPANLILKGNQEEQIYLPSGAVLPFLQGEEFLINDETYRVKPNDVFLPDIRNFHSQIEQITKSFLNAPYLWGGKTHFGIDCSGFSQTVFKLLGIKLKRDASQQAEQGQTVDFLVEAKAGDLAFFDNEEGRITHVGIMLSNSEIIHASGKVKIDRIDNQGIFAADQNKYTHKLRIVKRLVL
jgi:gamma-D-glutamyl-L-lysine dipeptidyl-peptidase